MCIRTHTHTRTKHVDPTWVFFFLLQYLHFQIKLRLSKVICSNNKILGPQSSRGSELLYQKAAPSEWHSEKTLLRFLEHHMCAIMPKLRELIFSVWQHDAAVCPPKSLSGLRHGQVLRCTPGGKEEIC